MKREEEWTSEQERDRSSRRREMETYWIVFS